MNKTYLVAGGASLVSLAAGAAGGYFFAKNKLGKEFDERLDLELKNTEKNFAVLLMQAKEQKPSLEELAAQSAAVEEVDDETEWPLTDEEIADLEQRAVEGKTALTDYQGISTKAAESGTSSDPAAMARKIFEKTNPRPLPPRDDNNGRFVKQTSEQTVDGSTPPYIISHDDFVADPFSYEQENYRYFAAEETIINYADEILDNDHVGEDNLKTFRESNPEAGAIMCVRNEGLEHDYELQYMTESLTEYLGLQES